MRIDRSKQKPKGMRILIHGGPGIGKTTFACKGKVPTLVIDGEGGLSSIPLDGRLLEVDDQTDGTWVDFENAVVEASKASEQIVVVDSVDYFERLLHAHLCATDPKYLKAKKEEDSEEQEPPITEAWGGWGKAFHVAAGVFRKIMKIFDSMIENGRTVILIAHTSIVRSENPEGDNYERFEPKLDKRLRALFEEWCDVIIHARWAMRIDDKGKVTTNGKRIAKIIGSPTVCAKNRYGARQDLPLDLDAVLALAVPSKVDSVARKPRDGWAEAFDAAILDGLSEEDKAKGKALLDRIETEEQKAKAMQWIEGRKRG